MRCKEVINVVDGRRLGRIIDMVIDEKKEKVLGIVVPSLRHGWPFFKPCEDIFIPFCNICKIGDDVILVELYGNAIKGSISKSDKPQKDGEGYDNKSQDYAEYYGNAPDYNSVKNYQNCATNTTYSGKN